MPDLLRKAYLNLIGIDNQQLTYIMIPKKSIYWP
jgi:hypothetical protein